MKTIWDYKVSYKYGANVPGYDGFHYGEDRTAPEGTPVTVNGVEIGLVGSTGKSTGPHLHVGKWANGKSNNPNGRGKTLKNPIVTDIDTIGKTDNGKFVRISAEGYSWVYLHLDKVLVKPGDKLEQDMHKGKSAETHYKEKLAWKKRSDAHYKAYQSALKEIAALKKQLANTQPTDPNAVTITKDGLWGVIKSLFGKKG